MNAVSPRPGFRCLLLCAVFLCAAGSLLAQRVAQDASAPAPAPQAGASSPQSSSSSYSGDLAGSTKWKDTGVDLKPGDSVEVTASGKLQYADAQQSTGPDGLPRGWKDLMRILPVNEAGRGALIARIGDSEAARPFQLGASHRFNAPVAGRLFLGINQMSNDTGTGSYHVDVKIVGHAAAGSADSLPVASTVPGFTRDILDKIPRRNDDNHGNLGDMTNFVLIGSEDRLRQLFQQAGWVLVDKTKEDAVLHGLLSSLTKQSYVEMPMSELYLFGRAQDFGFALAEPFEVVYQRHHNRVWKSPYSVNGQTVWVGAGTHDVGIERDQRTKNGVTHKIDPDVDKERDFVADSLVSTGLIAAKVYLSPSQPLTDARTATGGGFHSDGRVVVMQIRESSSGAGQGRGAAFGALFCSVLEKEHPDAGGWGPCSNFVESPPANRVALGPIPTNYRLAIIPGFLSACTAEAPAFKEGVEHLRAAHGLTVDSLPAPNRSSTDNGRDIARFLEDSYRKDPRKFIVIAYSKGAADVLEGLASDPLAARTVAALVTVAGAIGGSPIADLLPAQAQGWLQSVNLGGCAGDLSAALHSLRRDVRQDFLARHPDPGVPVYSVAAISSRANTSKLLLQSWQLLNAFGPRNDGQLESTDAVYPGGNNLGAVLADHWAVAMPFEDAADSRVLEFINHNHYPRTTLLESLVRLVTHDLNARASAQR